MTESKNQRTLITIATYNEIENLPKLVDAIFEQVSDVDILVVDDNSPDGTGDWCDQRGIKDARVHCLHREGKLGLGTATVAAMKYAIDRDYRLMLNMDADFSHHPKYLSGILERMNQEGDQQVDVVIGSRYVPGGGVIGWPLKRRMMSRCVNLYARTLLWLKPKDCSGAFRCHRVATLRKIDFDRIVSRGYSFQEEILWHLRRAGAKFAEVPIQFEDRIYGESKINSKEAYAALWILLRLGMIGR